MDESARIVVDVDAHYYENPRAFAQYVDEPWRTRFTLWTGQYYVPATGSSQTVDGRLGGRIKHDMGGLDRPTDREGVLGGMRYLGVDRVVLLPGVMLAISELTDRPRAVALCNGYIDHMLAEVVDPSRGVYVLPVAPNQSPPAAAELIDRVAGHPGVCGVAMITSGPVLPLGDPYYDPIYDACCRHDLPLVLHSAPARPGGNESGLGLQTYMENHCMGFVVNNMLQMTSIVFQGVPERFPKLRIVFQEAGVLYIPLMMYRLDTTYSMMRSDAPLLKKPPSAYVREFYFGTQPIERGVGNAYLSAVVDAIGGPERLMFATDWPHRDFDSPVVIDRLPFLDDRGRAAILGGNALRVFRFAGADGSGVGANGSAAGADGSAAGASGGIHRAAPGGPAVR